MLGVLAAVVIYDLNQAKHAILRNFEQQAELLAVMGVAVER